MTIGDPKRLAALLKKLRAGAAADAASTPPSVLPENSDGFDDLLHQLIYSMMLWEATTTQATAALGRLRSHFADLNELRVCMADDTVEALGANYPLARERSLRLRCILHDIFTRQQVLSLAHLRTLARRDALAYLEGLEGMPPFVAHRIAVVCLDSHACPVDDRLRDCLVREKVLAEGTSAADAARFLTHQVRSEDALSSHMALQAWSDQQSPAKRVSKKPASTKKTAAPRAATPSTGAAAPKTKSAVSKSRASKS